METTNKLFLSIFIFLIFSVSAVALDVNIITENLQSTVGDATVISIQLTNDSIPVSNTLVNFTTTLGSVSPSSILTTASGMAEVSINSTVSGNGLINVSSGAAYNTTNVSFNSLPADSILIVSDPESNIAGNVTNISFTLVDQFNNINSTGDLDFNILINDVFGNTVHDIELTSSSSNIVSIFANSTFYSNSSSAAVSQNVTLSINSTVAGSVLIRADSGNINNSTTIQISPAALQKIITRYNDKYTVNTSSSISVSAYDKFDNPINNTNISLSVTSPSNTVYNSPVTYNSANILDPNGVTLLGGSFSTQLTTDKRAGDNIVHVSAGNGTILQNITIEGIADEVEELYISYTPNLVLSNNQDYYELTASPVDEFLNPKIPQSFPIQEQVLFSLNSNIVIVPLNNYGSARTIVGPTPYIEDVSVVATYKEGSITTNLTNTTDLYFVGGNLTRIDMYSVPSAVLAQDLNGNHESSISLVALDEWGHTLPNANILVNNTNTTLGDLTIQGINATNLINATTDANGRIYGTFISSNVSGNVTFTALSGSINASTNVEVKEDPFMSVSLYVTPPSVDTGGVINVTTIISIEGELPITRDTASAMLVLDRSGSMDPDYYAGSPIDVVTVIDRSGSMSGQPIIAARNAAKSFKNNLASNAQVGVVSYSDSSRVDIGLTLLNTSDNKALIDTAIDGISAGGWTAMGDGMADANTLLINGRSQSRKVMVVLTDGNTNSGSDQDGDNAVAIANANGITIYTIGLGTNLDESLLRGIASAAGGKYYNAPTSVDLQNIYNTIAQDISDYDVTEVQYGVDGFTPYDYNFQDSIEHYTLRFDGYDLDYTFDAGSEYGGSSAGECLIRINGDNFTTTPSQNTGTNNYAWDTYEYDITDYIVLGSNNITFYDYHDYLGYGLWTNEIRNVEILHNGTQVEYYAASNVLDGSGYSCSVNVSNPISSFSRSFLINESINDLKVQLDWQDNSSDIFLELTSPTGRVYGDGNDTTGYYFSNNSAYIWLHPLSYRYPEDDNDRVELGNWTVNVTGSVTGDGNFTISTYIDKKSATILSSHAFITSFDETKGDRAGLTLYSYDYINSTNKQTSYVHDNSSWVGYFTADNTAFYDFNVSWTDASALNIKLYDGVTLLSSSNGTGFSTVNSSLSNGDTYFIEVSKGSGSGTDTKFTIDVSSSILQTKMMAYYDYNGGASTPRYRKWDDPDWSIEKSANYLGGRPYYMVLESNPNHREMILGTSDDAYDVNLQVWDGDYWGSVIQVSNSTDAYSRRGFDIAYEQVSGDALAVFMNKSIDDGVARYRIWDGSSWSDGEATDATSPGAGDIGWVELASDPSSDEIILVTGDDERDIRAQVWDGSSWDNPVVITDNSRATSYKCFDVIYEQESGHAMLVWSDVVDNAVRYRAWNGNSWNPAKNISSLGESVYWIKMAADPNSDDIIMASLDLSNDIYVNTWNGNSWSSRTLIESNASTYSKRAVDVSFEQISGTGIVAWGNTSSDINTSYTSYKPKYITWDGASWSAESLASNITGTPQWVQLTSDPLSNDVYLMTSDSYSDINVQKWNGSAWGSALEVETSATSSYECFDLAISSQVVSPSSTAVSWSEWTADVVSTLDGSSLTHLGNTIDTFSAAGLTAIDEGMFSANNELSSVNGNSTIVLMTDGLDNSGYHSLLEEAQRAKANNTTIYTVGFGINESEIDPILAEIASITGGEYYFAPNSSVLESIFTGIAEQLTNFSAGGPVMTINVPYNYIAPQAAAKVTYVAGSANTTVGNSSYFVVPTGPGSGTSDPSVTLSTPKSSIEWQLPSMGPGEKWGLWYQLVVNGAGYIPVIMPDSSVTYTDLDGQNVTVYIPAGGSVPTGGSVAPLLSYGLGELKLVPENRLVKIDDQSEIELTLKDITGNSSYGYVVVYSSLGYFDTYENPVNVSVVGSNTIDFSSAIAGNAYITAYAYNINNASDVLMASDRIIVRPNGLITIS